MQATRAKIDSACATVINAEAVILEPTMFNTPSAALPHLSVLYFTSQPSPCSPDRTSAPRLRPPSTDIMTVSLDYADFPHILFGMLAECDAKTPNTPRLLCRSTKVTVDM